MNTQSYKTKSLSANDVDRTWYIVDAEGKTLGRMASKIASVLKGKHRPTYTPNADCGDYVIVINAEKVRLTGNKMNDKEYLTYSGYQGGQKKTTPKELLQKKPHAVVEYAVKGMLPKTKLGNVMFKKLYVYAGNEHPHAAQKPQNLD